MAKPVTPQDMFDLWQKMVNPGAYPLQSLMFPVLDAKELEKKIAELETVEHWLKANLSMLGLTIRSLEFQRQMLKGGEDLGEAVRKGQAADDESAANPALWAWNMMTQAGGEAAEVMKRSAEAMSPAAEAADEAPAQAAPRKSKPKPRARKKK